MANQVEITITADAKDAEKGIKKVKSGFQNMKDSIVKNRKAIGLGITALGVGMEALAQSQAGLTDSTRKLANATQFTEDEIRTMATSLSNATFPLEEALGLMKLGAQQGLESGEALKEYAAFWDTVGDATGLSSEALAKSGAALAALGIEVGNESELLGAFGLIANESTSSVKDFLDGVNRMAPELSDMGISVNEAAVILTAMERELGIVGRTARTEFKEAMEQSETGIAGVLEQLGLSESQLDTYRIKLEESTGVMGDQAAAYASTKTVMDKLKSSFSDLTFENGALIGKASMLAPIFMAVGPIMAGFGVIMGVLTPVLSAAKLAFIGLNLSMGPILLAVVAIAAAIAIGVLVWKNWDKIVATMKKTFEKITEVYNSKLGWLLPAGPLIKGILFLKKNWEEIFNFIKETIQKVFTKITDLYNSKLGWLLPAGPLVKAILFLKNNWDEIWAGIQTTFKTVTDALVSTFRSVKGTILGIWDGMVSGIKSAIDSIMSTIDRVISAASRVGGAIRSVTTLGGLIGREHGGPVGAGQPVIVGERRPELFVPHTSGTILPRITGAGGGGGGGITVNLTINGNILGMDDFEQKITSVIRDAVLGGGFSGVLARA